MSEYLSNKLKEIRLQKGLTQAEAAKKIGITRSSLANYESNIREPDYQTLKKIAECYSVRSDDLIGIGDAMDALYTSIFGEYDIADEIDSFGGILIEKDSPEGKLFQTLHGATEEEIEQAIKIIEALRK